MSIPLRNTLISVLQSCCAAPELIRLARARFAVKAILVKACAALHRRLRGDDFDFSRDLDNKALTENDAQVLAWFLGRSTTCKELRCVGCDFPSELRVIALLGAVAIVAAPMKDAKCGKGWSVRNSRGCTQPRWQQRRRRGHVRCCKRAEGQLNPSGAAVSVAK